MERKRKNVLSMGFFLFGILFLISLVSATSNLVSPGESSIVSSLFGIPIWVIVLLVIIVVGRILKKRK